MNYPCAIVRIIERVTKLSHPGGNLIRFEGLLLFLGAQVRKGFAVDVFHGNAAGAFVVYEVVNSNDMRMRQFQAAFCLTRELIKQRTILNHQVWKKFQSDIALQFFIACQPDNSHSASPENLDQRVAAKDFLSAGELTRRRVCDTACTFVSHVDRVYIIKDGKESQSWKTEAFSDSRGLLSLHRRYFASAI